MFSNDNHFLSESIIKGWWYKFASVNWATIGSDIGLLPIQCQAIIWNHADLFSNGPLGTSFSEMPIKIE